MADPHEFSQKVIEAVAARTQWYEENVIPKILNDYRLIHTCVKNLYDLMIKRSLIKEDPYRLDKKITGIKPPENTPFAETDRASVIGVRFSDYETMLDWICTYYKFSVENLTIGEIKKLLDFNNSFQWTAFSANSEHTNTRGLCEMVLGMRRNADALTASTITDILSKCAKASQEISAAFKDLGNFEKEAYKSRIRKEIFAHPKFDANKAFDSANDEMSQIKKAFPAVFGKQLPFYTQLVEDIVKEDQGANKDALQDALLKKLVVPTAESKKKKAKQVDPRELLFAAVQSLCAYTTPFQTICSRLNDNNAIIQEEANSGFAKFLSLLRKAFNAEEKPVVYEIFIGEKNAETQKKHRVNFRPFVADIQKRAAFYNSFATRNSPGYKKLLSINSKKIQDFLEKQISEIKNIEIVLKGFDAYFKNSSPKEIRSKIKGLSMELTTLKNNTINTSQYLADYISYLEEQEQLKKLGIAEQ